MMNIEPIGFFKRYLISASPSVTQSFRGESFSAAFMRDISGWSPNNESPEKNQILCKIASKFSVGYEELKGLDAFLRSGLFDLLTNIMQNNLDELEIEFASEFAETNYSTKARLWRENLEKCGQLHKIRPVIIISSDLHNVVSCLTDFAEIYKEKIRCHTTFPPHFYPIRKYLSGSNSSVLA